MPQKSKENLLAERSMTDQQNKVAIPGGYFESGPNIHRYTDAAGRIIPSVTQVFGLLSMTNFEFINREVLARKSQIGVAVHSAIQFLCEGVLDWDSVATEAMNYVVAGESWIRDQGFTSLEQEGQGICTLPTGAAYGYSYDHLGTMVYKGRLRHVILDLKTTTQTSPTWKLQTSAYAMAAPKLPAGERYLRCILQLKPDGRFTPHYFESRDDEIAWQQALFIAIWGLNEGLYSLEKAA